MRKRETIIEMFATFLFLEDSKGNCSNWRFDRELKSNMKKQVRLSLEASERAWVQYWLEAALQNPPMFLSVKHLSAYLQEPCFWAAKKVYPKFATPDLTFFDCFQIASIEVVMKKCVKIFKGYDQNKSSTKTWGQMRIESSLRECLLKGRRIQGQSDWILLRDTKAEKFLEALVTQGIDESRLQSYQLAVECFQKHYPKKKSEPTNKKLPEPTPDQWQMMVQDYNELRSSCGVEDEVQEEAIKTLLDICVQSRRASKQDKIYDTLGIDAPNFPEIPFNERYEEAEELEEWQQIEMVFSGTLATLPREAQTILMLEYGLEIGQTEIAKIFGIKQYQVSRKVSVAKEKLLNKVCVWMLENLSGSLTTEEIKQKYKETQEEIRQRSKQIHDWLKSYCKKPFQNFLHEIMVYELTDNIKLMELCCGRELLSTTPKFKREDVAEQLNIPVIQVNQELEYSRQYLLAKLKEEIQKTNFIAPSRLNFIWNYARIIIEALPKISLWSSKDLERFALVCSVTKLQQTINLAVDISKMISADQQLLKFIDNFMINAPYAVFKAKVNVQEVKKC